MATYLIGDIHGCYNEFKNILTQASFNPKIDHLWLTGDIVGRGPNSLEVLRLLRTLDKSIHMVLGNHDLHLLSTYAGVNNSKPENCIIPILEAPDADELIHWLRYQPLLQIDKVKQLIMTHAGITPQWDIITACKCAQEIEDALQDNNNYPLFLSSIYKPIPNNWSNNLNRTMRMQFSTNVFTRMRYCYPNGQLAMEHQDYIKEIPTFLQPWFNLNGLIFKDYNIVFGHWSSLKGLGTPHNIYGLDTGCCWGGELTLLRWEDKKFFSVPSLTKNNKSL